MVRFSEGKKSSNRTLLRKRQSCQVIRRGRYLSSLSVLVHLTTLCKYVGSFQLMTQCSIEPRPSMTSLVNLQSTKRWFIDSTSLLHRQHRIGPVQSFLSRLSQVLILLCKQSQTKHITFSGKLNFHMLTKIFSGESW